MTVAILLPVYNGETFIRECLSSILSQDFKDFKCFILDDGSTDNTTKIAHELTTDDARFCLINLPHNGLPKTLNFGLNLVRNFDYVARMDADDIMHPCRLRKQISYLENHPEIELVTSVMTPLEYGFPNFEVLEPIYYSSTEIYNYLVSHNVINHPAVMFRGRLLRYLTYRDFDRLEDYDLWLRTVTPNNAVMLGYPLVGYRSRLGRKVNYLQELKLRLENRGRPVVSLLSRVGMQALGIEKTLSYRSHGLTRMGVMNLIVIQDSVILPNLHYHYINNLGFEKGTFLVVPNFYSDIGMDICSYTMSEWEHDFNLSLIHITGDLYRAYRENGHILDVCVREGLVVQSLEFSNDYSPLSFSLYSSKLYLTKDYRTEELQYFNSDGSVALRQEKGKWYLNEHQTSDEELLFGVLDTLFEKGGHLIRDVVTETYQELEEYCRHKGIPYLGMVHFNPIDYKTGEIVDSVKRLPFNAVISSCESMKKNLPHHDVEFIPPIYLEAHKDHFIRKKDKRFLVLTSDFDGKGNKELLSWLDELPFDIEVDIYGLDDCYYTPKSEKIRMMGYVPTQLIDWSVYTGYLSHSKSETFSIALVEALSQGCIPVVFNSDYAHIYLTEKVGGFTYHNKEEFEKAILKVKQIDEEYRLLLSKRIRELYSFKAFEKNFKKILN